MPLYCAASGLVAGFFVVIGVEVQFRRQSKAALRALMVEVASNKEAAAEMTRSLAPQERLSWVIQIRAGSNILFGTLNCLTWFDCSMKQR